MIVDPDSPQVKPLPGSVPGIKSSDQIVSEIHGAMAALPPEHQAALDHGISMMKSPESAAPAAPSQGAEAPPIATPSSAAPASPVADPSQPADAGIAEGLALPNTRSISGRTALLESPRMMSPSIGAYEPLPSPPSGAVTELKRLRDTGSGVSQIHNPFLKTLGTIADVVGSGFFPQFAQFVPGSSAHHEQLVGNKQAEVKQDDDLANNDEKRHLEHAQALNQESLPELAQQKVDSANYKTDSTRELGDAKTAISKGELDRKTDADKHKQALDLFKSGRKIDESGQVVNIPYEEMTPDQQVTHDLKLSQRELADSNADLADARAKNLPEQMKLAERRIANAQHNQQVALRRLDLSEKQFEMRAHGTQGGVALPGSMVGDDGTPIGTAFQQNVRPTGQQRNKANLADSAAEQISDIKNIVKKRHDIFGPMNGRTTDFSVWLGSEDPDAKRFLTARTIAADHLAGVFGGRSEAALKALDQAIGQFKENPAAVEAGLDQVVKGNEVFQNAGKMKTTGSNAVSGGEKITYKSNGVTYHIPKDQESDFLKDHPGAKK